MIETEHFLEHVACQLCALSAVAATAAACEHLNMKSPETVNPYSAKPPTLHYTLTQAESKLKSHGPLICKDFWMQLTSWD